MRAHQSRRGSSRVTWKAWTQATATVLHPLHPPHYQTAFCLLAQVPNPRQPQDALDHGIAVEEARSALAAALTEPIGPLFISEDASTAPFLEYDPSQTFQVVLGTAIQWWLSLPRSEMASSRTLHSIFGVLGLKPRGRIIRCRAKGMRLAVDRKVRLQRRRTCSIGMFLWKRVQGLPKIRVKLQPSSDKKIVVRPGSG